MNKIESEVGIAVQKRYKNKGSWDNKVHVTFRHAKGNYRSILGCNVPYYPNYPCFYTFFVLPSLLHSQFYSIVFYAFTMALGWLSVLLYTIYGNLTDLCQNFRMLQICVNFFSVSVCLPLAALSLISFYGWYVFKLQCINYHIARKFGGGLYLVVWRSAFTTAKLKSVNFLLNHQI